MEVEFERGGKFTATLLEDEASKTVDIIWNLLPLEFEVKHAMWSGQIAFGFVDVNYKGVENAKRIMQPGDIAFHPHFIPLGSANKPVPHEILFIYGQRHLVYATCGYPAMVNHFASITEGNLKELLEIGTRLSEKGIEKVILRKKY